MRGTFALVVTAGIAAAVGVSMWRSAGEDAQGRSDPDGGVGLDRSSNPGTGEASGPRPEEDRRAPASTGPLAGRIDGLLASGDAAGAARLILDAESGTLRDPGLRRRAHRVADGLVAQADGGEVPTRAATELRVLARRLSAAVFDCDASTREERDLALRRSQAMFEVLVRGNGAPPELVFRHKVASGENVWSLARGAWKSAGASVAPGFVLWVNGVSDARRVRAGQTLKVPLEPLTVLVRKSTFDLTVLLGGAPVARFPVAVGADAKTPVGVFRATDCLKNPDWTIGGRRIPFGSPEHIIGTRWIGLGGAAGADGIGIHGTNDDASMGKAVSMGCVRLRNADVEAVFEWVGPGTSVEIRD